MIAPPEEVIVVDASAIVALVSDPGGTGQWVGQELGSRPLVAPEVMPFEVANALRRRLLAGTIDGAAAGRALERLRALPVAMFPFAQEMDRAWALRANLTMYDASYVALAELLDAPLVTLDARIARAPGVRCVVRAFGV